MAGTEISTPAPTQPATSTRCPAEEVRRRRRAGRAETVAQLKHLPIVSNWTGMEKGKPATNGVTLPNVKDALTQLGPGELTASFRTRPSWLGSKAAAEYIHAPDSEGGCPLEQRRRRWPEKGFALDDPNTRSRSPTGVSQTQPSPRPSAINTQRVEPVDPSAATLIRLDDGVTNQRRTVNFM